MFRTRIIDYIVFRQFGIGRRQWVVSYWKQEPGDPEFVARVNTREQAWQIVHLLIEVETDRRHAAFDGLINFSNFKREDSA